MKISFYRYSTSAKYDSPAADALDALVIEVAADDAMANLGCVHRDGKPA